MEKKCRVLVGMSGGIDSSAVCMLLQEQGYDVVGMTLRMWDLPAHFPTPGQTEPQHALEARMLAERLGIPHHTLDIRKEFREEVVQSFIDEYMNGRTPNPCVMCNRYFKWKYLLSEADRLGCDFVATGHYARIEQTDGHYTLLQGIDPKKDQSYFLWRLGQKELSRTLFPLGGMTKEYIKSYVLERGFKEKVEKKESMEVCFIPGDYRDFLREMIPGLDEQVAGGFFVDRIGRKIGQHKGFPFYTIGQRKGLEIALGKPAYVIKINAVKNTIRLGDAEELLTREMLVEHPEFENRERYADRTISVRIRYRSTPLPARIQPLDDGNMKVVFEKDASAITPGQSAVFYDGDRVIGGGIIADQRALKRYQTPKEA